MGNTDRRTLREYELVAEIGKGGMGAVYRAIHTRLQRTVAIKILPAERLSDSRSVQRFQREMAAVGTLDHPNVVRATDAGEAGGTHFLVMEFVEGCNAAQAVAAGPLRVADACEIAMQTGLGLQHAYEHGLVHRDIKPANILLSLSGEVKVVDFGLTRLQAAPLASSELTSTSEIMGTPDYMAPEQGLDAHVVDIRSDLYSLGCTLYKLLSGVAPYSGDEYDTPLKKIVAHAHSPAVPLPELRDGLPQDLSSIVGRLLSKDPDDRYDIPQDVAEALAPFCEGSDLAALAASTHADVASAQPLEPMDSTRIGDSSESATDRKLVSKGDAPSSVRPSDAPGRGSRLVARAATAVIFGLLVALVAFGIRQEVNSRPQAAAIRALQAQLDAGEHEQMRKYLDLLKEKSPRIYEAAEVRQLEASLQAVAAEADRQAQVQVVVNTVRAHLANPLWDAPPPVEQQHWTLVAVTQTELEAGQELARTESEWTELALLKQEIGKRQQALQALVDGQFNEDLSVLVERMQNEQDDMDALQTLFAEFQALQKRGRVSPELATRVDPLLARIRSLMATFQRLQEEVRRLKRITERAGSVREFKVELERYIKDFPEDNRSTDFRRVVEQEAVLWDDVEAWNQFSRQWAGQDFAHIEPRRARLFVEQMRAFRRDHPSFSGLDQASMFGSVANAIGQRVDAAGNSINRQLNSLFDDPLIADLYMIESTNGTRYYSTKPPTARADGFVCQYIKDMDAEYVGTKLLLKRQVRTSVGGWKAPQSLFATQAQGLLARIDDAGWETTFATMLQQLYTDEAIDPILKVWLLKPILDNACRGSWFLTEHYQSQLGLLEDDGGTIDFNVNWVDPDQQAQHEADKVRRDARGLLRNLQTFAVPPEVLQKSAAELKTDAFSKQYQWIGWLHRNRDDSWTCSVSPAVERDRSGPLMMVYTPDRSETPRLERVGELLQERVELSPALTAEFVEGRPIFLELAR